MDTDLVRLAQNGDKEAFTSLAATRVDRYLAASHRILREINLAPLVDQARRGDAEAFDSLARMVGDRCMVNGK